MKQNIKIDGYFLTYAKLFAVIPRIWKRIINTANRPINLDVHKKTLGDISYYYRSCQYFYNILADNNTQSLAQAKWEEKNHKRETSMEAILLFG